MRISDLGVAFVDVPMRMPFRYGIATMTSAVHAVVQLTLDDSGNQSTGASGENLPPKWFTKDPGTTDSQDLSAMRDSVTQAVENARGLQGESVFDMWSRLQKRMREQAGDTPGLLVGLGVSLVERALIDAFLRAQNLPLHAALRDDVLGFDVASIHPELSGLFPADLLPKVPADRIAVRHTVGMGDQVSGPSSRPAGLPVSLEEVIRETGVKFLKLKTQGDLSQDIPRLQEIFEVIAARPGVSFTIDGNESMHSPDHLDSWLTGLLDHPVIGARVTEGLIAVEQPVHRSVALRPDMAPVLHQLTGRVPIIIDESDDWPETVRIAMDLGYSGGTYKGCKGVFRGIANAMLVAVRGANRPTLLTAEDLTTLPPFALNQDLAVACAIGLGHIERNGHHYFGRVAPVGNDVDDLLAKMHPDAFTQDAAGTTRLRIDDGYIATGSLNRAPFGLLPELDLSRTKENAR